MSWEEYLAGRSRNMRSQLGRRRRRLEREHELVLRLADAATLDADLDSLFSLHTGRWRGRGGSAALDTASMGFHRDFARAALERGWLRLWLMEVDERPAAAWYGWRIGDRYAYYQAGFDESFGDYSIGMLLLAHTIESAIGEGAAVYDLLLGTEEYKLRFATGERRVRDFIVSSPLHPVRVAALGEAAVRRPIERLPEESRRRVKDRLRRAADRLPFR
jgi:CelD/BcsL family acetyltransferase involved in cellulose biosynthesis